MTNLEWIRTLSEEEFADWLYDEWLHHLQYRWSSSRGGLIIWLKDRKTENSSEKPNNCELQTIRCPKCGRTDYIRDMEKDMGIKGSHYKYKCINCNTYIKDEPTISKMEQVDWKDQMWAEAVEDEPQTCEECEHWNDTEDGCADRHGCKTEPQTERNE